MTRGQTTFSEPTASLLLVNQSEKDKEVLMDKQKYTKLDNNRSKKWCAANWKLHKTPQEAGQFIDLFLQKAKDFLTDSCCQIVIYPQNFSCPILAEKTKNTPLIWGGQNAYISSSGAYTGENSYTLLKCLGASTVLVGHSERRTLFKETNEMIATKMQLASQAGLIPMLCVGENEQECQMKQTKKVLAEQLKIGLSRFDLTRPLLIAYEPVWAISTGNPATLEIIEEAHLWIKQTLSSLYNFKENIPVLYGGSVKPENAQKLAHGKNVDGFLVGGASLEVDSFLTIIKTLNTN